MRPTLFTATLRRLLTWLVSLIMVLSVCSPAKALTVRFEETPDNSPTGWSWDAPIGGVLGWHRVDDPQFIRVDPTIRRESKPIVYYPDLGFLPPARSGRACWWFGATSGPGIGTYIGPNFDITQGDSAANARPTGGISNTVDCNGLDPSNNANYIYGTLTSPSINLSGMDRATLSFWTWWEVEAPGGDDMIVQVSADGGDFVTIDPVSVTEPHKVIEDRRLKPSNGDVIDYVSQSTWGNNTPGVWGQLFYDVSGYVGKSIRVRYLFKTNDHKANGYRGWMVDDMRVDDSPMPDMSVITVTPSSISPEAGVYADSSIGPLVTAYGTGFEPGAKVYFVGPNGEAFQAQHVTVVFHTKLMAEIPLALWQDDANLGAMRLVIINPDQRQTVRDAAFTTVNAYHEYPDIVSITDPSGNPLSRITTNASATAIRINGSGFQQGAKVSLRSEEVLQVTSVTPTAIEAIVPSNLPLGYRNVTVLNPDGLEAVLFAGLIKIVDRTDGPLAGTVYNAYTGATVSGATVTTRGSFTSSKYVTTAGDGTYVQPAADAGPNEVAVAAPGYATDEGYIYVEPELGNTMDVALAPLAENAGDYRFVLTWNKDAGADQLDLDLVVFMDDGLDCLYVSKDPLNRDVTTAQGGRAQFIRDATAGPGPESAIYRSGGPDGLSVWVRKASGTVDLSRCGAVVKVYKGDTLVSTVRVPSAPREMGAWHVIDIIDPLTEVVREVNALANIQDARCARRLCLYDLSEGGALLNMSQQSHSVAVRNSEHCRWQATCDASWIRLDQAQGEGNGTLTFTASANTTNRQRSAEILIGDRRYQVLQSGNAYAPEAPSGQVVGQDSSGWFSNAPTESAANSGSSGKGGGGGGCVMDPQADGSTTFGVTALGAWAARRASRRRSQA